MLCLSDDCSNNSNQNIKYVKMIKQNCYRLLKLTNNIIDINKIDAGRFDLNLGNFDIVKVVEDICMSVADYIKSKDISFVFDTDVEEKIIACDPEKIERILLNLLSNAIKFTKTGGSVVVNINDLSDFIEISVKDTGIGIPESKQFLVFERFVQLDNSLSRNFEGSGIGLALVRNLVEMHDGGIRLESEEGRGSKFIISLPCKTINEGTSTISKSSNSASGSDRVLKINIELSDIYFD
jgi:signal transduction histidine kinase